MSVNFLNSVKISLSRQENGELTPSALVFEKNLESFFPKYQTPQSSGMDVCSPIESILKPNSRILIPLGFCVELEDGFEIQVRSRSGFALKSGVFVLNSPGTIDADYRGELGVILFNTTLEDFHIPVGLRIAQIVLQFVPKISWEFSDKLEKTERGSGGFGSTGVKP